MSGQRTHLAKLYSSPGSSNTGTVSRMLSYEICSDDYVAVRAYLIRQHLLRVPVWLLPGELYSLTITWQLCVIFDDFSKFSLCTCLVCRPTLQLQHYVVIFTIMLMIIMIKRCSSSHSQVTQIRPTKHGYYRPHPLGLSPFRIKPGFHYPSWRPELTGDRFPLPVNTGRVDGRAFPLAELDFDEGLNVQNTV